jgi:hypothetical protein
VIGDWAVTSIHSDYNNGDITIIADESHYLHLGLNDDLTFDYVENGFFDDVETVATGEWSDDGESIYLCEDGNTDPCLAYEYEVTAEKLILINIQFTSIVNRRQSPFLPALLPTMQPQSRPLPDEDLSGLAVDGYVEASVARVPLNEH